MNRRDFIKKTVQTTAAVAGAAVLSPAAFAAKNREKQKMKILVLTGSPRKNGNSNTLADSFIKGAIEAGHEVARFDAAFKNVHPCIACNACGMDGPCVFKDDFEYVRDNIVTADAVVFATPMYYFGISAQLKAVVDRFYAINGKIHRPKKAVLLDYLGWTDAGQVIASGVWQAGAVDGTPFVKQAYELGKSL